MFRSVAVLIGVVCAMVSLPLVEGCSNSEPFSDDADISIEDGARTGQSATGWLTPGAPLTIAVETGARLTIPARAVQQATSVTLRRPPNPEAKRLTRSIKAAYRLASAPYVLTPHGSRLALPARLELPVGREGASRVVFAWLEDEQDTTWKIIGIPTNASGSVAIDLEHFSVLVLLEPVDPFDAGGSAGAMLRPMEHRWASVHPVALQRMSAGPVTLPR